jgi:4-hydroxybenzoyl-CoA thioesterase
MPDPYHFRIAWFDCDPAGIVFYPRLLAYMNEAAHGYLEQLGFSLAALNARGVIGVPMVSLSADYKRVLKCGDHARIETEVTEIGRSSIRFTHRIMAGADLMCEGREVRVYAAKTGDGEIKATPVHDDVRQALLGARA